MRGKQEHAVAELEKAWARHHVPTRPEVLPAVEVPESFRPKRCWVHGYGMCLCSGRGLIVWLFKQRFQTTLCSLCPKGSDMRQWLQGGSLVVRMGDGYWGHIALMYLRPRRPTFIDLTWQQDDFWGNYTLLSARLTEDSM